MARKRSASVWILVSCACACREVPRSGGQSGTDSGDGKLAPVCLDAVPFQQASERNVVWDGLPLAELRSSLDGEHAISGDWMRTEGKVQLQVSALGHGGGTYVPSSNDPECETARIPTQLALAVSDVFAIAPVTVDVFLYAYASGFAELEFDETAFSHPEELPAAATARGRLHLTVATIQGALQISSAEVWWGEHLLGDFGSNQLSLRHLPALAVAADCAQAEVADVYANRDQDEAFESVVGQWAVCDAAHRLSLAGVEIRDDRTWSAILPGDDLPLGSGFDREGSVRIDPSGLRDWFSVRLLGPDWQPFVGPPRRSPSGDTLYLSDTRLVRLGRSANAAAAPSFAAGERAGVAGCASNENGFEPWPDQADAFDASLAGSWAICSGGSGSVRFDASGVELLAADASPLERLPYLGSSRPLSSPYPDANVGVLEVEHESWYLVRSTQPVKLRARRTRSADKAELGTLILSAEP